MDTQWLRRSLPVALIAGVVATAFVLAKTFTGAPAGGAQALPRLVLDQDPIHDFGTARYGDGGRHAWRIGNTGRGDLELWLDEAPSCGCTVASLVKGRRERIPPGGAMDVVLEWRARKSINEAFAQSATIGTNDPGRPWVTLRLSGWVSAAVVAAPEMVNLTPLFRGEARRLDIAVFSPDREDLAIGDVVPSRPDLISTATRRLAPDELARLRAKAGYRLGVEIGPGMPTGWMSETLTVHTNHPDRPTLEVLVTGVVTGPISAAPSRLNLPGEGRRGRASYDIMLSVHDGRETQLDVAHKPEAVGVSISPAPAPAGKRRYRLSVTAPAKAVAGRKADSIILRTDHPEAGEISIPVSFGTRRPGVPTAVSTADAPGAMR